MRTEVPQDLLATVRETKRRGGRCFLVVAEPANPLEAEALAASAGLKVDLSTICPNCNGAGSIGLQIIVGGPYASVPKIQSSPPEGRDQDVPARATYLDGHWYRQKTRTYQCPTCFGSGVDKPAIESAKELEFGR